MIENKIRWSNKTVFVSIIASCMLGALISLNQVECAAASHPIANQHEPSVSKNMTPTTSSEIAKQALASAKILMISGSSDEALIACRCIIKDYPKSSESIKAYEMLAQIFERLGDRTQAIDSWTQFAKSTTDAASAGRSVQNISRLYLAERQYIKGSSALQVLAKQRSDMVFYNICNMEAGRLIYASGDNTALLAHWRAAVNSSDNKSMPVVISDIVNIYSDNHAFAAGAKTLQQLALEHHESAFVGMSMIEAGKLLDISGDSNGALSDYLKGVAGSRDTCYGANAVIFVKNIWIGRGKTAKALDELRRISTVFQGSRAGSRAVYCEAELLSALGDKRSAEQRLTMLLKHCPKMWDEASDAKELLARLKHANVRK